MARFLYSLLLYMLSTAVHAEDIRFCSIGMGRFGSYTAKLAIEKGFKMVAAFTRYSKHTKTVGELLQMEDDESLAFHVSGMNKLEQIIDETQPHFCIDATNGTLAAVFPHFRRLIAKGVHILTLCNEAVFPYTRFYWKPRQLARSLDGLAKQHNVVILGGGFSDSVIIPVVPSMAAAMMQVDTIRITGLLDIDQGSEEDAAYLGVGVAEDAFKDHTANTSIFGFDEWQRAVVEAIADKMGHPILEMEDKKLQTIQLYTRRECMRVEEENGVPSRALNRVIAKGECAGMNVTVLGNAEGGIQILYTVIMAVIPDKTERNDIEVVLQGRSTIKFAIKDMDEFMWTAVSLLHRVPMVLNELEPGFHDVNKLRVNRYWRSVQDWNVGESETADTDIAESPEESAAATQSKQDL